MNSKEILKPKVVTAIPGEKSKIYLKKQEKHESNARAYPRNFPLAIKQAKGSYIIDMDDNVYLDFLCGAGVLALGHNHPEIVTALEKQLHDPMHVLDFPTALKEKFIDELLMMMPETMRDTMKVHCCAPSGADAIDAAIKLCKIYTGRNNVISFQGGFHGSSQSTLSITGLRAVKENLGDLMAGVNFFPYSYCYRCPLSLNEKNCEINCMKFLKNSLLDENGGVKKPAAIILEVVQGEGGVIVAKKEFLLQLRKITIELDIPLIIDEIQSGCGRTGHWCAFEHYPIEPDVIVLSKALGGGMPISVILYNKKMDLWQCAAHTGTFRGNQLSFAASIRFMQLIKEQKILENVKTQGNRLKQALLNLKRQYSLLGDIRGLGLMLGVEILNPDTGISSSEIAKKIQKISLQKGLIVELGGRGDCVVRFLPPLNISEIEIKQALTIFSDALYSITAQLKK